MKVGIAVDDSGSRVSGHAGKTRTWLVFDCHPGQPLPAPRRVVLTQEQLPHDFDDRGPHPLHGVEIMVAASAGDGFVRHMAHWGATVLLTGEAEPNAALEKILRGEALAQTRFDITATLCKLRDMFSRH